MDGKTFTGGTDISATRRIRDFPMDTAAARRTEDDESDMPDAVRKAENAVAALAESFLEWIGDDISRARTALDAAGARAGDNPDELRAIFEVMHNVKGQGGSFGYGLLTDIAGSLCDYIRQGGGAADEKQLKVIAAHFIALDFVLEKNIQGDGGDIGVQLKAKLDKLIANVPPPA